MGCQKCLRPSFSLRDGGWCWCWLLDGSRVDHVKHVELAVQNVSTLKLFLNSVAWALFQMLVDRRVYSQWKGLNIPAISLFVTVLGTPDLGI